MQMRGDGDTACVAVEIEASPRSAPMDTQGARDPILGASDHFDLWTFARSAGTYHLVRQPTTEKSFQVSGTPLRLCSPCSVN